MRTKTSATIKTIVFTFIAPGTVTVLLPFVILRWVSRVCAIGFDPLSMVGVAMIAAGVVVYATCAWGFVRFGLGTPAPIDPPIHLVVRGPYRWSRNPMYVGIVCILLGEAIACRSVALLGYAAAIFLGFNIFIFGYEEPTLRRLFGQEYDDYRCRVPRWIGWKQTRDG
jgi:protein-S-isoprenylcysteine O-methyltransferase Ste14